MDLAPARALRDPVTGMNGPEHAWALRLFEKSILKQAKYRALVRYVGETVAFTFETP